MGVLIFSCPIAHWLLTGFSFDFLSGDELELLDEARDLFLGPAEDMTADIPREDPNNSGRLLGGTAFERCRQHPVKDSSRCYSQHDPSVSVGTHGSYVRRKISWTP